MSLGRPALGLCVAAALLFAAPAGAAEKAEYKVQIASSSAAGALFALGAAWSKLINENSAWVRATPVATGGGTENLRLIGAGEVEMATLVGPEAAGAYNGLDKYKGHDEFKKLRAIWGYTYGGFQIVVLADSGLKSMEDLKGKRVSVGAPGSSGLVYAVELLSRHGLAAGKDYRRETLTGGSGAAALRDGNLDAFIFGAPVPVSYVSDVASARKVRLIPIDPAKAKPMVDANPGFFVADFPKDGYPNQANAAAVPGLQWKQYWAARAEMPADAVYEATKALFEHLDEFHLAHSSARVVTLASALEEIRIPLHPGAIRYFREKGLPIPAELVPPEAK